MARGRLLSLHIVFSVSYSVTVRRIVLAYVSRRLWTARLQLIDAVVTLAVACGLVGALILSRTLWCRFSRSLYLCRRLRPWVRQSFLCNAGSQIAILIPVGLLGRLINRLLRSVWWFRVLGCSRLLDVKMWDVLPVNLVPSRLL